MDGGSRLIGEWQLAPGTWHVEIGTARFEYLSNKKRGWLEAEVERLLRG